MQPTLNDVKKVRSTLIRRLALRGHPHNWIRPATVNRVFWGMLAYLTKFPRLFQQIALGAIVYLARFPLIRRIVSLSETYFLGKVLEQTTTPGPTGGAMGYLFRNHDPGLSAKDIYRDIFSSERLRQDYQSQMGPCCRQSGMSRLDGSSSRPSRPGDR
jgi:hypothetical protein